jgi:hypothetical protein
MSCQAAADATVVVIAMLLAPLQPLAEVPATKELPATKAVDRPLEPQRATAHRFGAFATGLADSGSLSQGALGVQFGALWRPSEFTFELGVAYFPSASVDYASSPIGSSVSAGVSPPAAYSLAGGVTASLVAVDARVCVALFERVVALAPCASVEVGYLAAAGFGSASGSRSATLGIAAAPGVLAALPLGERWRVRFGIDLVIPFYRANLSVFVAAGPAQYYASTAQLNRSAAGRAALGLEFLFL